MAKTKLPPDPAEAAVEKTAETPGPGDNINGKAARFSVNTTPEGRVAWGSAHDRTREKLRLIIADPDLPRELGITRPAVAQGKAADTIPPEMCGVIYDALSVLLKGIAQRSGYTDDQAAVLTFSAEEKAALGPPTVAVLNKYNAAFGKYQEELTLGVVFGSIVAGKLAVLRAGDKPGTGPTGIVLRTSQEEKGA